MVTIPRTRECACLALTKARKVIRLTSRAQATISCHSNTSKRLQINKTGQWLPLANNGRIRTLCTALLLSSCHNNNNNNNNNNSSSSNNKTTTTTTATRGEPYATVLTYGFTSYCELNSLNISLQDRRVALGEGLEKWAGWERRNPGPCVRVWKKLLVGPPIFIHVKISQFVTTGLLPE